jgi:hypothetical protein
VDWWEAGGIETCLSTYGTHLNALEFFVVSKTNHNLDSLRRPYIKTEAS